MGQPDSKRPKQAGTQQRPLENPKRNVSGNSSGDGKPMGKPGRPRSEPTRPVMLRLTEVQRKKYLERGGARWVKRLIDEL